MGKMGPQNKQHYHPAITSQKQRSQLSMLDESFGAATASFLVAGSEFFGATVAAMDDSAMMTGEYAGLDSDPSVALAFGFMFVTLLTLISLAPEADDLKAELLEEDKFVTAQADKVDSIAKMEMAGKDSLAKRKSSDTASTSNTSLQSRDLPQEVGALLKAYKDADDDLFLRALPLLVGRIQSTTAELNKTQRLLRAAKEEIRTMEDQCDLRKYQLDKAEEKLKDMRAQLKDGR